MIFLYTLFIIQLFSIQFMITGASEEFSLGIEDATKTKQKIEEKVKEIPQIEDEVKNEILEIVRTEFAELLCKKCFISVDQDKTVKWGTSQRCQRCKRRSVFERL